MARTNESPFPEIHLKKSFLKTPFSFLEDSFLKMWLLTIFSLSKHLKEENLPAV